MTRFALADLHKLLTPHVPLGKSRLETLCLRELCPKVGDGHH
jgi:hypothetical protein